VAIAVDWQWVKTKMDKRTFAQLDELNSAKLNGSFVLNLASLKVK
jgi:hypothetical protein